MEKFEDNLGYKPSHFHGSGIKYKSGNEVRHISAGSFQPPFPYLFSVMQDMGYDDFTFIVESPDSYEDVRLLRRMWNEPSEFFDKIPGKRKTLGDFT